MRGQRGSQRPSVYAPDLGYGRSAHLSGHWLDRLPAIDADIEDLAALLESDRTPDAKPVPLGEQIRPAVSANHTPPADFDPGEPVSLELHVKGGTSVLSGVSVHYRHVNHAESYVVAETDVVGDCFSVVIPGDYTDSLYALQYCVLPARRAGCARDESHYPSAQACQSNEHRATHSGFAIFELHRQVNGRMPAGVAENDRSQSLQRCER